MIPLLGSKCLFFFCFRFHEIIVEKLARLRKRQSFSLPFEIYGFHEAKRNGERFYVTANLSRESLNASKEFVLGDGQTYGGYENAKLEPGTEYRAYIRGITEANGVKKNIAIRVVGLAM